LNDGQQGSGSGLDADTVDSKESSGLGNTIDGKTIIENSDGDIEVNPSNIVDNSSIIVNPDNNLATAKPDLVFDFEDDLNGFQTFGDTNSNYERTSNFRYNGDYSFQMYSEGQSGEGGIEKTIDLSGYTLLKIYVKTRYPYDNDEIFLRVDGNKIYSETTNAWISWKEINYDISNIDGNTKIEAGIDADGDSDFIYFYVDYVQVIQE
jgi:hypothetical protein